jgi:hypothetical protein
MVRSLRVPGFEGKLLTLDLVATQQRRVRQRYWNVQDCVPLGQSRRRED